MSHLIEPAELLGRLGEPSVRVVDCRFVLGSPGAGEGLWLEGHIPGASYLDVDRDLSAPPSDAGRHPLPARADFEAAARGAGICAQSRVVAYDEAGEGGAARLWWLLRHFGGPAALVLNGGLRAWREAGGPLRAGAEEVAPGDLDAAATPRRATSSRSGSSRTPPRCSTPARRSATAGRSSPWTRWPVTSRGRATFPSPSSSPRDAFSSRLRCASASPRPA